MRLAMLPAVLATVLLNAAGVSLAASPADVDARLATQNALFEEWYQLDLSVHPQRATAYGDYRYNDRLDRLSLSALGAEHTSDLKFLARLRAISTDGFSDQDAMSHEILVRTLQQRIANYGFKEFEMPVSQMDGPHLDFADLPLAVPFETVKQYQDYIARLHQIPRAFAETEEVLRAGMKDRLMPVRFLLEKVAGQCDGIISSDPFLRPTRTFPAGISAADQQRLRTAITDAVTREVLPAYRAFGVFVATEYAPQGRRALPSLLCNPAGYLDPRAAQQNDARESADEFKQEGETACLVDAGELAR